MRWYKADLSIEHSQTDNTLLWLKRCYRALFISLLLSPFMIHFIPHSLRTGDYAHHIVIGIAMCLGGLGLFLRARISEETGRIEGDVVFRGVRARSVEQHVEPGRFSGTILFTKIVGCLFLLLGLGLIFASWWSSYRAS